MRCPYCDKPDTRVIDSRQTEDGYVVRRRRVCDSCGKRFTTYESAEASILMIVKKDGRREAFERKKVINGLKKACEKRPVSMGAIEDIAARIEQKLYALGEKEVLSDRVGEYVMDELRKTDQVAYIRFASVYREFADVEKFAEEIDELRKHSAHSAARTKQIAIDGPSGAGKSTIAKGVAAKLGIDYIDTGAMYRAMALKAKMTGTDVTDENALAELLADTVIDFENGQVTLDGEAVEKEIRTPEISEGASVIAAIPAVREKLVEAQRAIGRSKNVVLDGRDIGTNVFPDSKYKFYLTATAEERANRRYKELKERGEDVTYEEVLKDVEARDYRDMNRDVDPLRKADDAIEIDSTNMTIDEVVDFVIERIGD